MTKVLFFDIDGTLAINGQIIDSNLKALRELKDKGYLTFICTGRAPYYAQKLFGDLVSGIISCNGRYISYENKRILGKALTQEEIDNIKNKLESIHCGGLFVSDTFSSPYSLNEEMLEEVKSEYGEERIISQTAPYYTCDFFYHDLEERNQLINIFKDEFIINDHGGHGSTDNSTIYFNKGHAVRYVLDYFNINRKDSYAFGDGYNDQAMIENAGTGIAMGNGVETLKEKADYITDSIENDGIYNALVHFKLL